MGERASKGGIRAVHGGLPGDCSPLLRFGAAFGAGFGAAGREPDAEGDEEEEEDDGTG